MANRPIKKYKIITSVATAADIATLPDNMKVLGAEVFVEDEQVTYSFNPATGTFPAPVSGASPFVLIAEKLAVDLGGPAQESLTYANGCNATNTVPVFFVVDKTNGTDNYVNSELVEGTPSVAIITIDNGITNSTGQDAPVNLVATNEGTIATFQLTDGTTLTKAQLIAELLANVTNGNYELTNPTGDEIHVTSATNTSNPNGFNITMFSTHPTIDALLLALFTEVQPFTGGANDQTLNANVNVRLDSKDLIQYLNGQTAIAQMVNAGDSALITLPTYSVGKSGNIVVDKDTPMFEQFRVDMYAYGIKLS